MTILMIVACLLDCGCASRKASTSTRDKSNQHVFLDPIALYTDSETDSLVASLLVNNLSGYRIAISLTDIQYLMQTAKLQTNEGDLCKLTWNQHSGALVGDAKEYAVTAPPGASVQHFSLSEMVIDYKLIDQIDELRCTYTGVVHYRDMNSSEVHRAVVDGQSILRVLLHK